MEPILIIYILSGVILLMIIVIIILALKLKSWFNNNIKITSDSAIQFGKMLIPNCAKDSNNIKCITFNTIKTHPDMFPTKNTINIDSTKYALQLVGLFLEYLNKTDPVLIKNAEGIKIPIGLKNPHIIFDLIKEKSNPLILSFTTLDDTMMYFIFRGTQSLDDITTDLSYNYYNMKDPSYDDSMIHIHKGFNDIYNEIKDNIFASISPNVKK